MYYPTRRRDLVFSNYHALTIEAFTPTQHFLFEADILFKLRLPPTQCTPEIDLPLQHTLPFIAIVQNCASYAHVSCLTAVFGQLGGLAASSKCIMKNSTFQFAAKRRLLFCHRQHDDIRPAILSE